ncbi:MAG: NAD(+) synthase [Ignavibacteria bacterium]|nr:NAD(+) synthase [Ignavibacteria bacterium]
MIKNIFRTKFKDNNWVRVAAVAPEIRVGNVDFNTEKIIETIELLWKNDVQFVVFPELSLTGYTCGDLFYQSALLRKTILGLEKIINFSKNKPIVIIVGFPFSLEGKLFNCAGLINDGNLLGLVHKTYIPNTQEFYERRWFSNISNFKEVELFGKIVPFGNNLVFKDIVNTNLTLGIEICQDLWAVHPVSTELTKAGANIIFNLSASDEWIGKMHYRRELVLSQSARCNCAYVYAGCSPWESTTDLVFSGHCIIAENGKLLGETKRFSFSSEYIIADVDIELIAKERIFNDSFPEVHSNDFRVVSVPFNIDDIQPESIYRGIKPYPFIPEDETKRREVCEEIFEIQSTGLARRLLYVGVKDIVIGISGGLDSTLALLVATRTFDKLNFSRSGIHAVILPGFGTSQITLENAKNLVSLLGVESRIIDIKESVRLHLKEIGSDFEKYDLVFENAQARERMQILMDLANKLNALVVGTGNLSEIALGWSTYNADHMSMYNVNAGVPKTLVRYVIDWVANEVFSGEMSKFLQNIIATPVSPELLPPENNEISQKTEEIIGPFDLNDFFMFYFFRYGFGPRKIFEMARIAFNDKYESNVILHWMNNFYVRFFTNQFKRSCMPDGPKVGTVAFSPRGNWRMPSDADYSIWIEELKNIGFEND